MKVNVQFTIRPGDEPSEKIRVSELLAHIEDSLDAACHYVHEKSGRANVRLQVVTARVTGMDMNNDA